MSKHTPGPIQVVTWLDSNGWPIYQIEGAHESKATQEANRRLFEASPDLLEALRDIIDTKESGGDLLGVIDAARAAIAKAEGN